MNFSFQWVPTRRKGCRYYVRYGARTKYTLGFNTKAEASAWIDELDHVEWRVGFLFHMRGDDFDVEVVDRRGKSL